MMEQAVKERYFSLLRTSLTRSGETELSEAAELGRDLMLAEVPLKEITKMHEEAVLRLTEEAPEVTLSETVRSTTAPLMELITAYDMAFREGSESRYRLLAENIADVIWTVDMNLRITYISPSAERLVGYTVEEAMSQTLEKVLAPSSFETLMKILEEELAIEKEEQKDLFRVRTFEAEIRRKDGSTVWTETRANFLRDQNGQAIGILGVARDITERKRAKEMLLQLGKALETMRLGVTITDMNGTIIYINPAEAEIHGCQMKDVVGKHVGIFAPFRLKKPLTSEEMEKLEEERIWQRESINKRLDDGREFPVQLTSAIIKDQAGQPVGIVTCCENITERKRAVEALRESKEEYRELADSIADVFFAMDKDLRYTYWNKASEKLTGIKAEDALGKSIFEIFPDTEDTRRAVAVYREVLKTQQPQTFVNEYTLDNRNYFFEISTYSSKDGIAVFTKDITERKRMEEELKESEERYRNLIENSQDSIVVMDMKGNVKFANKATEKLTGYYQEEGIGMNIRKVTPLKYLPKSLARLKEAKSGKPIPYFESMVKRKDGKVIPVESGGQAIFKEGKPVGVQVITRDITERKRAEEAVQNAAAEWKTTFDTMPDIVMLLDRDQRIIRANKALTKALGLTFEEILGQKCYQLLHEIDAPPESCLFAQAIADGEEHTEEVYYEKLGRDFHVVVTPFLDSSGTPTGTVQVMRDITELKKVQRELREKERLATMGEVAAGMAHEIKNPLFAVTSGIQVLEAEMKLDQAQKDTFDIILKEALRVDRLIRQLIGFTIRQELNRTSFQITMLINEVISLNEGLLRAGKIKIKKTLPKNIPPVYADRDGIIQVLVSLLLNAIDVSRKGDTIEIVCGINGDKQTVVIQVKDRGPGIPKEQRERIFNPFVSTKKGSSGMGLAISKKIILEHGGNIRFESGKKKGTTFVVELPLTE